jgi:general secretion pathway protein A
MTARTPLYAAHFGLREAPFRATPDPRFFYSNPVYREAYATLLYGVLQRKGFIALTGEVGTGKTTLLRRLMDELGPPVRFVLFYNTTLTFDETIEFICGELALPVDGLSRVQRLQRLNDLLIAEAQKGGNVVLLIDEAQNLGADVLENLRLISNLETSTEKLLQIVLVGQPELDAKLAIRPCARSRSASPSAIASSRCGSRRSSSSSSTGSRSAAPPRATSSPPRP